ncbi:MAG TPA: dihydrodipicolinate synthase family protein [Acidimicrobiales bacterium]|jgi:4-hydroxy-tetrahydrodipicolinate synthase|nr:dihydrodipicolinate synthase family protein [Acidimicrobiales bacterium]
MTKFQPSTHVISLTPFDDADNLDVDALRGHLRRLRDGGVGVYVGGGGSGEGYSLSEAEVDTILHVAVEELKGHVPVRAMGVEPRSAKEMLRLARMVEAAGVDAMQLYSLDAGHGRQPRHDELETYFCDILDNTSVKCVLSSHQSVGYFVPVDMLERLVARYDHLVGLNITCPDITYLVRIVDAVGDRVEIHVGGPMQGLTALSLGAQGFLTSEGNLAPKLCRSVIDRWVAGDLPGAADAFALLLRLFTGLSGVGGVSGTKAALGMLGLPGGVPRKPRLPVLPEWSQKIARMLDELDIRRVEGI